MNLHTAVIGKRRAGVADVDRGGEARRASLAATRGERRDRSGSPAAGTTTPVYVREQLPADARFAGPAIVEQLDCTTVIEPANRVEVDPIGNLIVTVP